MAKSNLENKLLAVVRVRGTAKVRQSIAETLNRLNLKRVNNLVLLRGSTSNLGMVKKCNDFITYGPIDEPTLKALLVKKEVVLNDEQVKELFECKKSAKELNIKVPFGMKPPRHGYEGVKANVAAGGALGNRGEKIALLLKRMM